MEAFFDFIADHPGFVVEILLIPPAVAVFREDGYDTIGRVVFAFWLAGYAISLLVVVQVIGFLAGSDLRRSWLVVITLFSLLVLFPCLYFIYHFYESVVQRARDAGHGRAIAYLAVLPPLNLAVFAYLLWRPGVPPATLRRNRQRRRRRWRKLMSRIAALPRGWR